MKVRQVGKEGGDVFLMKTKTHHITETSRTNAAPDAGMAADQNLPGLALVRQSVLVGVRHSLEHMERDLVRVEQFLLQRADMNVQHQTSFLLL